MRDSLSKPMTSRPAPVAAALVALLLGGCSLMPVYERPAAPVAMRERIVIASGNDCARKNTQHRQVNR